MKTYNDETLEKGYKENSMYQPNTVRGTATEKDMEEYYRKCATIETKRKPEEKPKRVMKLKKLVLDNGKEMKYYSYE